jgi:hypothetical protein
MNLRKSFSKYNAKRVTIDGIKFDSKAEGEYYLFLKNSDNFEILDMQTKIYLSRAKLLYKPDFLVKDHIEKSVYYIDIKGLETPVFKLKKRLWKAYIKDELRLIKKSGKNFKTIEVINGT